MAVYHPVISYRIVNHLNLATVRDQKCTVFTKCGTVINVFYM